jgi:transcriptional regulator with XRE-family HTH domain
MTEFASTLRRERIRRDLSQKSLAEMIGVTKQTILAYENDKSKPRIGLVTPIEVALKIPRGMLSDIIADKPEY